MSAMPHSVRELAELVGGQVLGDDRTMIEAARPLSEAGPGHITFVEGERQLRLLAQCQASAVLLKPGLAEDNPGRVWITVADPLSAFAAIYQHLHCRPRPQPRGIDPHAVIAPTARLGPDVTVQAGAFIGDGTVVGARCRIYPGAVIGCDCVLGEDVVIHANAVLYDGCVLGNRVIVHAGAVVGKEGFGYRQVAGRHVKVPQLGWVEIGDDVEIGAGTTIDRGTFQATRIGSGTKIDNQVQIGHNCRIGRHNLIVSQVGIAGSTTTGDYVVIAGQAGIADHLTIGHQVIIGAQAGVMNDIPDGQRVLGTPARPEREAKVHHLHLTRLPELFRQVRGIRRRLGLTEEEE
jgi:UDP-3-O-[3-hydroxymyristoyl] glucosamine N-acyltransferase